jgi:uncharacterized surface protein with fasciclin (FAS1) repeats
MNKIATSLILVSLLLSACGSAVSTPKVVEVTKSADQPTVEPTLMPQAPAEPTAEHTQTPEVLLEPTSTPTEESAPAESNAPSDEQLKGRVPINEILTHDEAALKVYTQEDILQFIRELNATMLIAELGKEGPFTVFAPAYKFEDIPQGSLSVDQFVTAIKSHIVPGWYFEEDLLAMGGQSLPTLAEGVTLQISVKDGVVYLNDVAMLTQTDILGSNGVVHVIDQFLMPAAE